jgi:hypothetical protein
MYAPARTACKPHAAFRQDDGRQRWTRMGPVFRDLRLVVKLITRRAAGHERENRRPANASSSGADASNVSCSLYTYHARMCSPGPGQEEGEEGKGRGTYEIILLHEGDDVESLEVRQPRGELREELARRDKDHQAPTGVEVRARTWSAR